MCKHIKRYLIYVFSCVGPISKLSFSLNTESKEALISVYWPRESIERGHIGLLQKESKPLHFPSLSRLFDFLWNWKSIFTPEKSFEISLPVQSTVKNWILTIKILRCDLENSHSQKIGTVGTYAILEVTSTP